MRNEISSVTRLLETKSFYAVSESNNSTDGTIFDLTGYYKRTFYVNDVMRLTGKTEFLFWKSSVGVVCIGGDKH